MESVFGREQLLPEAYTFNRDIIEIHKDAYLRRLEFLGYKFEDWQSLTTTVRVQEAGSLSLDSLIVGPDYYYDDTEANDKELDNEPILPISIMGADGARLVSSDIPPSTARQIYMNGPSRFQAELENAQHPVRVITMRLVFSGLTSEKKRDNDVYIFSAPDMPPVAVHGEDVAYLRTLEDLDAIDKVEKAFGPEAVEVLSNETCGIIIDALKTALNAQTLKYMKSS